MATMWKENGTFEKTGKERGESIWIQEQYRFEDQESTARESRPKLSQDITTEVAIIGGGLAGILTAYLLMERGVSSIVIECDEVGHGITKNTTAKITSQHNLIYNKLIMYKGEELAREYADANQKALQKYEDLINSLGISCDYQVLPNYIFSLDNEQRIKQEVEAARKLGLPAALTKETPLPFRVEAAVRFDKQAQFHPLKFLDAVAKKVTVYEHTRVKELLDKGRIITDGGSVRAKAIVIATHYPFINAPGYYFLRMHQERQYVIALEGEDIVNKAKLDGMYLDADSDGFSFRNYREYLLLGGGNHRAGKYNPPDAYHKLEKAAKKWYPASNIKYTWSNQDCMTPDSVPYIGRYSVNTPNLYVATGFNKWGMSTSMAAAMIISDMITHRENHFHRVFNPRRLMFSGTGVLLKDVGVVTKSLLSEHLNIVRNKLMDIEPGKAGIIMKDGQRLGVYRDMEDRYYFISTKCPHLGCSLEWNQNELTWDCPCHGSRFDYHGNLINNPALRDVFDACVRKKK